MIFHIYYQYGYVSYRKYLDWCHVKMYEKCKHKHDKQIEYQLMDNDRYDEIHDM